MSDYISIQLSLGYKTITHIRKDAIKVIHPVKETSYSSNYYRYIMEYAVGDKSYETAFEGEKGEVLPHRFNLLKELGLKSEEYTEAYCLVLDFFKNDLKKTELWFTTDNPNLGGCSAELLFSADRGHKVLSFIKNSLKENKIE